MVRMRLSVLCGVLGLFFSVPALQGWSVPSFLKRGVVKNVLIGSISAGAVAAICAFLFVYARKKAQREAHELVAKLKVLQEAYDSLKERFDALSAGELIKHAEAHLAVLREEIEKLAEQHHTDIAADSVSAQNLIQNVCDTNDTKLLEKSARVKARIDEMLALAKKKGGHS